LRPSCAAYRAPCRTFGRLPWLPDWGLKRLQVRPGTPPLRRHGPFSPHKIRPETFRELSAKSRVRDEVNVLEYYRKFLTVATLSSRTIASIQHRLLQEVPPQHSGHYRGTLQEGVSIPPDLRALPHSERSRAGTSPQTTFNGERGHKGKTHDKHRSHAKRHHALECYFATPSCLSLADSPMSDYRAEDTVVVFTHEKANRTVRPSRLRRRSVQDCSVPDYRIDPYFL
jgi:hypothetical protein